MHRPDPLGLLLLAWLFLGLPCIALLSARRFHASAGTEPSEGVPSLPSRASIFAGTLCFLLILFTLSWLVGRQFDYPFFGVPFFGVREIASGLLALGTLALLRWVNRAIRSAAERRAMPIYRLMPRTRVEWTLYVVTALAAGVAEEVAYRGVGWEVLSVALGNAWLAAILLALAFAVAHALQGWKSMGVIFAIALLMHALVAVTDTLVVAMVVHAGYDIVAGIIGARDARRFGVPERA